MSNAIFVLFLHDLDTSISLFLTLHILLYNVFPCELYLSFQSPKTWLARILLECWLRKRSRLGLVEMTWYLF